VSLKSCNPKSKLIKNIDDSSKWHLKSDSTVHLSGFVAELDEFLVMLTHFAATLFVPLLPNVFQLVKVATIAHFLRNFY
jgi:hypothetical protein